MSIRVAMIAIAVSASGAPASAQADRNPHPAKVSKPAATAPVVLASASDVHRPSPTDTERVEPVRRPAPRVTTCRCGDPQLSNDPPGDGQPDE